jgi:acyl-CoA synthetase (AMP-forming)/AMP-acid ligase II
VTGPAVSSGYAAGADDAAFVGGGFLTGDLGATIGADGRLRLKGRISAFVNVAGRKVQPDEVEGLRAHPLVADARVRHARSAPG